MPVNYDIYSMNAGSAVAQILQDILQRRRDEARQAMLDKLGHEDQQSILEQRRHQMEQDRARTDLERQRTDVARLDSESQRAVNQARLEESAENLYQSRVKGLPVGTAPEDIPDESLRKGIESRGQFRVYQPEGPTESGDPLPSYRGFVGTPEQQEQERRRSYVEDIASYGEGVTPQQATALRLAAEGINVPSSMTEQLYPFRIYDEQGKLVSEDPNRMMPASQANEILSHDPVSGYAAMMRPDRYQVTYKDGTKRTMLMRPNDALKLQSDPTVSSVDPILDINPNVTGPLGRINSADVNALRASKSNLEGWKRVVEDAERGWGSASDAQKQGLAAAQSNYATTISSMIAKLTDDPEIQQIALAIIQDPIFGQMPLDQVLIDPRFKEQVPGQITPEDYRVLSRILLLHQSPNLPGLEILQ